MLKNLPILFLLFLFACSFSKQQDDMTIIDLRSSAMVFGRDKQMVTIDNSAQVAYKDNMEIYIGPSLRYNLDYIKDKDGNVIDEKVKSIDTTYQAFVKRKGQTQGISYVWGTKDFGKGTIINVDSVWATFPFYGEDIERFSDDIGKPVNLIEVGGKRLEKYLMPHKIGQTDSIYRYYDKSLTDIPFSFSEKFDKLNKSKLVRIYFVMNEIPKGEYIPDMAIPRREFYYQMKVVHEKDTKKYADLFKRFQEDSDRLHLK